MAQRVSTQNLVMVRGDEMAWPITVKKNGAAFDLTGATIRMTAKWRLADADAAAVFSVYSPSNGITITSAVNGQATITVAKTLTSSLPPGRVELYYDIQVTESGGAPHTVATGRLYIEPDISITTP